MMDPLNNNFLNKNFDLDKNLIKKKTTKKSKITKEEFLKLL